MRKIKVAYAMSFPHFIRGAERNLLHLLSQLDRRKFSPVIVAESKGPLLSDFERLKVPVYISEYNTSSGFKRLLRIIKKEKVHILQSSSFGMSTGRAARLAGIISINWVQSHIDAACQGWSTKRKKYISEVLSLLADEIVVVSRYLKGQFSPQQAVKTHLVYNGIDVRKYHDHSSDIMAGEQPSLIQREKSVGMMAHLMPQKRHLDFIRAAPLVRKIIPGVKFFIFGSPYPIPESRKYKREILDAIKRGKLTQTVFLKNFKDDASAFVENIDLFVLPSVNEALSLALMEAMAYGKPVIASDSGGIPELVKHNKTGLLVPPEDPLRLAGAIVELLRDPARARTLARAGRKRVEQKFAVTGMVRSFENLYTKVAVDGAKRSL